MCLPLGKLQERTLAHDTYDGIEYQVVSNGRGVRCGYIRLLPGHPWFKEAYDKINASCHGGLTFAAFGTACPTHGQTDEWWIGFDCGHAGDRWDPELVEDPEFLAMGSIFFTQGQLRTTQYVVDQCKRLIDQANNDAYLVGV